ncbi:hypothetical protein QFZ28_000692 [Neobacillus niacini]|uniref:hypothetical protein n=1 Tax=Neobacillus niacini TaxID=86668 RepID=UPI0027814F55|nr:hypothetical protein [Neobacillus niacini]MDQ1000292.1 hypothetical protein [Neobacillus niacini]
MAIILIGLIQIMMSLLSRIAPTIIGKGIPLFVPGDQENKLTLVDVRSFKQFAELHYEAKK